MDYRKLAVTFGALCFAAVVGGCSEESMENTKESMQKATDAVKETASDVADSAGDAMDATAEATGDAVDSMGEMADDAGDSMSAMADDVSDATSDAMDSVSDAASDAADSAGTSKYVSAQNWYSLLTRGIEDDLLPVAEQAGISVIPYFPLESGLLTGKYRKGQDNPEGSRFAQWGDGFKTDTKMDKVEALIAYGESIDKTMLELAMGGLTNRPQVATVIAGVTKPGQIRQNVAAGNVTLTNAQLGEIDAICKG